MSLRARALSRANQQRRRKWKLDTIHALLKPEHQTELVEMVGDPSIPASAPCPDCHLDHQGECF